MISSTLKYMLYTMKGEDEDTLISDYSYTGATLSCEKYCEYIRKWGVSKNGILTLANNVNISSEGNAIKAFVDVAAPVTTLSMMVDNWISIRKCA